jgi:GT2 family glycosyltransferase
MTERVSVIVCTRDREALLVDTVESILRGDQVPHELVVVDQSRAPHAALADDARIRYVHAPDRGLCRARNVGLAVASHPVVAFADDDVIAAPGWLGALLSALGDEGERRVAAGQVVPTEPERPGAFTSSHYVDDEPKVYRGRIDRDPLGGGNMAVYRSAFQAVGDFDERLGAGARFSAADDNDMGLRLLEAGYEIAYVPEAILYHRAWRPRWSYPALRWRYGRGKGGFYAKHRRLEDGHITRRMRRDIGHRLRRLPVSVIRRPRQAVGDAAYVAGILTGLVQWIAAERGDGRPRTELHVVVLWESARDAQERILADLTRRFRVREVLEVRWSPDRFARNLTRFYGSALPSNSEKELHVGTGPFLLALVEDERPSYGLRRTTGGVRRVNKNMLAAKQRYRRWTGGGHRVHTSDDAGEAARDLFLLLGRPEARPRPSGGLLELDLVGDRGWHDLEELVTALRLATPVVVESDGDPIRMRVGDVWWAAVLAGAEAPGDDAVEAHIELDVAGRHRQIELRAAERPPNTLRDRLRRR